MVAAYPKALAHSGAGAVNVAQAKMGLRLRLKHGHAFGPILALSPLVSMLEAHTDPRGSSLACHLKGNTKRLRSSPPRQVKLKLAFGGATQLVLALRELNSCVLFFFL